MSGTASRHSLADHAVPSPSRAACACSVRAGEGAALALPVVPCPQNLLHGAGGMGVKGEAESGYVCAFLPSPSLPPLSIVMSLHYTIVMPEHCYIYMLPSAMPQHNHSCVLLLLPHLGVATSVHCPQYSTTENNQVSIFFPNPSAKNSCVLGATTPQLICVCTLLPCTVLEHVITNATILI